MILFASNSQEAADRAKMMLSWDVLNGVSAPQVLTWTNLVPRLLCVCVLGRGEGTRLYLDLPVKI